MRRGEKAITIDRRAWERARAGARPAADGPAPPIQPPIVAPLTGRAPGRPRWRLALRAPSGRPWAWTLLWGGLALGASIRLGAIALDPIVATYRSSSEIRALRAEYAGAREANERLRRQIDFLRSRSGVEEEARRLGWVRAGELPLRIVVQPMNATYHPGAVTREAEEGATRRPSGDPAATGPSRVPVKRVAGRATQGPTGGDARASAPRLLNPRPLPLLTPRAAGPKPRTPVAERIQQAIATWGATRWLGEMLNGRTER
jgi:hypothetical protein